MATDFQFARSVKEDCGYRGNEVFNFSSPCGSVHFKNVERVTYTFIAFPGVLLGFATVHNIVRELIGKCWKQHAWDFFQCLWSASVLALEVGLFLGMYVAATHSRKFSTIVSPSWVEAYDCTIQALAYGSATLIVGVKCFGIFCHGPESCRLAFMAKDTETTFEASLQLGLLTSIYISSGVATSAGFLSASVLSLSWGSMGLRTSCKGIVTSYQRRLFLGGSSWACQFFLFSYSHLLLRSAYVYLWEHGTTILP